MGSAISGVSIQTLVTDVNNNTELHSEPCQASKMELFVKWDYIFCYGLTSYDFWHGSEYAFVMYTVLCERFVTIGFKS